MAFGIRSKFLAWATIAALPFAAFGLRGLIQPETRAGAAHCLATPRVNSCEHDIFVAVEGAEGVRRFAPGSGLQPGEVVLQACKPPYLPALLAGELNSSVTRWGCRAAE